MTQLTPFDAEPDAELGRALREVLNGPEPDAFLARLRGAVGEARGESSLDVLARWAPVGLAAAAAAAVAVWLLLRPVPEPSELSTRLIAAAPARMEVAPAQPETDVLVTSLLEGR